MAEEQANKGSEADQVVVAPVKPKPENDAQSQQLVMLESLVRAGEPLVKQYLELQERTHTREVEFDAKVLVEESKRLRFFLVVAGIIALFVLGIAAALLLQGRDMAATNLISLVFTAGGTALGGYGFANRRSPKKLDTDD